MGRRRRWLLACAAAAGLGFVPWPVTGMVRRALASWTEGTGWDLTVAQAHWVPWGALQLRDLKVQTRGGGKVYLIRVEVWPKLLSLVSGALRTEWGLGEMRVDPGSFGIREPLAQEILSSGPVTTGGFGVVHLRGRDLTLENLALAGPLLRAEASGWIRTPAQIHLALEGKLARTVLFGMRLVGSDPPPQGLWEPFRLQMEGRPESPRLSFQSSFISFSSRPQRENRS